MTPTGDIVDVGARLQNARLALLWNSFCWFRDLAEENGSIDEFEADERIWKLRKEFAEAARAIDKMFQTEDFVVPLDKIGDMTKQIPELREKYGLYCVTVAHIGDGNIHVLPLNKYGLTPDEWFEKIKAFHADLFPRVYALGGKMSGEHGVGYRSWKSLPAIRRKGSEDHQRPSNGPLIPITS